jgi:ADP-heptose:LPS heptosyltransferase
LDIVRYIGIDTHDRSLRIDIPEAARAAALEELRSLGLAPGVPVIGLHIGAGKLENRWPVEKFVELAGKLESVHHARIVLFWGPKEDELKGAFTQLVRVPVIGAGHPGLARLASLFACCHALVCNDTGVMHLAAAAGVPLVSLFGPTDPGEWAPLGAAMISLRAPSHRMEDIPVEEVLAALERLSLRG